MKEWGNPILAGGWDTPRLAGTSKIHGSGKKESSRSSHRQRAVDLTSKDGKQNLI